MNSACVMLGSNIRPVENTRAALILLAGQVNITACSTPWETESHGFDGPRFLNTAVLVETELDAAALKSDVIHPIERQLGRVRTENKYAPRTIDLDVLVFNGEVLDESIWRHSFLALPAAELLPELAHPQDQISLQTRAGQLRNADTARPRPDLLPLWP